MGHGEMCVEEAQRTAAVRVPSLLSAAEVVQLLEAYSSVRDKCGLVTNKHGESDSNDWTTTFLHTDGHFAAMLPWLRKKLIDAAVAVDARQGWGLLDRPDVPFAVRVVEVHTVGVGGALPDRDHFDHGSLVTIDVMLSDSAGGAFEGGVLSTVECDDDETLRPAAPFEMGDATVFVSHKLHCVTPVTRGTRRVLVCELWNGVERTCAHRCEHHDGECPVTFEVSRAASRVRHMDSGEGLLGEDEYRSFLDETCESFHSEHAQERENARATLARVVALSAAADNAALQPEGASAAERDRRESELLALRQHIRTQARIRSNRFNFAFSLQPRPCGTRAEDAPLCCTHAVSGESMVLQACFICADCQDPSTEDAKCCCEACARLCHDGHAVVQLGYGRCSCDCGAEGGCAREHAARSRAAAARVLGRGGGTLSDRATAARGGPAAPTGDVPGFVVSRLVGLDAERAAQLRAECRRLARADDARSSAPASGGGRRAKASFWLQADATPRNSIEALAALTFRHRAAGLPGFDSAASGAEFWVQMAEEGAREALHYERDAALHAAFGVSVCPLVCTVTHVVAADDAAALRAAAPTLVFATRMSDSVHSEIHHAAVAYAAPATQVAFDGSLLHGAPAHAALVGAGAACGADSARPTRGAVLLYVNVWLDHRPPYVQPLPDGDGAESSGGGAHARAAAFLAPLRLRRLSEDAPAAELTASSSTDVEDVTLPLGSRSGGGASGDSKIPTEEEGGEESGLVLSMPLPRSDLASLRAAGADTVVLHFGGDADLCCCVTPAW